MRSISLGEQKGSQKARSSALQSTLAPRFSPFVKQFGKEAAKNGSLFGEPFAVGEMLCGSADSLREAKLRRGSKRIFRKKALRGSLYQLLLWLMPRMLETTQS